MKKGWQFFKDLIVVFSMIWVNLVLFALLLVVGALLLKISGAYAGASFPGLLLDAFHMAILERVAEESDGLMPILLSFLLPIGSAIILGVLRAFSVYMQKHEHREEWDIMVAKTFKEHIVICGVGELGQALAKRLHLDHPNTRIVLVDLRPGLHLEAGLNDSTIICLQADMTSLEALKNAGCHKARLVILAAGNDAFNLEAAYKVIQLNAQAQVWVRLHHRGLADLLDLARKPNIHFFSPYQQAADVIAGNLLHVEGESTVPIKKTKD
jgi:voltage-gated potassium channel